MKVTAIQSVKFMKLKRMLGIPQVYAIGLLESIWLYASTNAPRGDIGRFSNDDIASVIEWPGNADEMINALVKCGWFDESEEHRLIIHGWSEHCPTFVKGNIVRYGQTFADGVKLVKRDSPKDTPNELPKEPPKEYPYDTPMDTPTKPSQAKPSLAKLSEANPSVNTVSPVVAEQRTEPMIKPIDTILTFPCNGDPKEWHLTQSMLNHWQTLYPDMDLTAECRKAYAWIGSNKRKTSKGMAKFLVNWFNRANDGRSTQQPPMTTQYKSAAERANERFARIIEGTMQAQLDELPQPRLGELQ